MPGGIDYSKWDHLDDYSSSSDDEGNDGTATATATPRVTRLDAPSSVTFGGGSNNNTIEARPMITTKKMNAPTAAAAAATASSISADATQAPSPAVVPPENSARSNSNSNNETDQQKTTKQWTEKGGKVILPLLYYKTAATGTTTATTDHDSNNDKRELYWSQDRYSVTLRFQIFDDEKVNNITVDNILPFADRHCAVGSPEKPHLKVWGTKQTGTSTSTIKPIVLVEGTLPHPVHLANEEEEVDWCIESNINNKFVTINLYKAVPMQGMFVWWRRPLMEVEELPTDQFQQVTSSPSSQASQEFLQAWEEAHRLFKEKKKQQNSPVPI